MKHFDRGHVIFQLAIPSFSQYLSHALLITLCYLHSYFADQGVRSKVHAFGGKQHIALRWHVLRISSSSKPPTEI